MNSTKMNQISLILSLLAILLMISGVVFAAGQSSANYTIESDVISGGGGGESISTNYTAEHTTGQPTIGESSSTNYSNYAGFWHAAIGAPAPDTDGDGVPDNIDNCVNHPNLGQQDTDSDGYGNRCDADLDNDGFVGPNDYNIFGAAWYTADLNADFDSDGFVGPNDYNIFGSFWYSSAPW